MTEYEIILERLTSIENELKSLKAAQTAEKEMLTVDEVVSLTGIKQSTLYKMVHYNKIPYYKPNGRLLYFKRGEVLDFIKRGKVPSNDQLLEQNRKRELERALK